MDWNKINNFDPDQFHWLRPEWLWAIVPAFFVFLIFWWQYLKQDKWVQHIAPHLRAFVLKKGNTRAMWLPRVLMLLIWVIFAVAMAGPTWEKIEKPGKKSQEMLVILLDLSRSMLAEDLQPNRLERAKYKIEDLLKADPKVKTALIAYAGTAHTVIPLADDYATILLHLNALRPDIMPVPGTNLENGLILCNEIFEKSEAPGTLLLITDGIDQNDAGLLKNQFENQPDELIILPMATQKGAPIPTRIKGRFVTDKNGQQVQTFWDEKPLTSFSGMENVHKLQLTLDNSDMELLAKKIRDGRDFQEDNEDTEDEWLDRGYWVVFVLALLILLWFRRGFVVVFSLVFVVFLGGCQDFTWADLWYSRDFQAQKLLEQGDYLAAAKTYEDEMRKGIAFYKAGNFEEAVNAFTQDTSALGYYNLALSYAKLGNYQAAMEALNIAGEKDSGLEEIVQTSEAIQQILDGQKTEMIAQEFDEKEDGLAEMKQNNSPEDLSGGGQEATKEDMKKERLSEEVQSEIHSAKELDEVPEDFTSKGAGQEAAKKVLMKKVKDDPGQFLAKKFKFQLKRNPQKIKENGNTW